ncbi:MAG: response regulator transcription factor [Gaiellaceae bacterium]
MSSRILLVEDDEALRYAIARVFEADDYEVEPVEDGESALEVARLQHFDIVLLDIMLPGISGIEVCSRLRQESGVPIIMLTARGEEADRVLGLEIGADDYIPKPFSMAELRSRVRALLRRRRLDAREISDVQQVGALRLDRLRHRLDLRSEQIRLTPTEFRLLALLMEEPERVYSRREIMQHLWESSFIGDERTVDAHVRNLRRKIEDDPSAPARLLSVRGLGYQIVPS